MAGLLLSRLPGGVAGEAECSAHISVWAVDADKSLTVNAAIRCSDDKSTEKLEKWAGQPKYW